ncbi:predicted protein [Naegleria gruberi]|uniref:Predicted protein n=1 Tax=Naegleria gruberi TaxID=5762 RepID=D2VL27_NAEGR|nr:uncharacterized protein NAEGRDRAFT_80400 [Naegleria gruberi]EFC42464.1 predicted protein [Naegleria gruberi]|eukprot:XP_002675208.1 predicted protein [Naegleria gruberi strain NEG-M]
MKTRNMRPAALVACSLALLLVACVFGQQVIPITDIGISLHGTVEKDQWIYYSVDPSKFEFGQNDTGYATFMLTSLSGDSDLHVSITGVPNGIPCTNCIFSADTPFSDTQTVDKSDNTKWPAPGGIFYIGVHGFSVAEFVFNVWSSNKFVHLTDGTPQQAKALRGTYTYFRLELPHLLATNLSISVTPIDGDPDIFVSSQTQYPTSNNYEWSSRSYGFDIVNIQHDTQMNPGLVYWIGVYAYNDVHFTIVARQSETAVRLPEGHAVGDLIEADQMEYYVYNNLQFQRLLISLIPLTSRGDPDLYIKFGSVPTLTDYDYSQRSMGNDAFEIEKASSQLGYYYIGVHGYARDTKYRILVTTEEANTVCADGVSYAGRLLTNELNYYKFSHADTESRVTVTVKVYSGAVTLYYASHSRPTPQKYDRMEVLQAGEQTINMMLPAIVQDYFFAVHGVSNADYSIIISTNQVPSPLVDGYAIYWARVPKNYYRHFYFEADDFDTSDVSITVDPRLGDVDLYVSTEDYFPTKDNYTWSSNSYSKDTVHIAANDPLAKGKKLFRISVFGFQESNFFTIIAMQTNTTVILLDDVSTPGTVTRRDYITYKYNVEGTSNLRVSVQPTSEGSVTVFWSRTNPKPNMFHNDGTSDDFGGSVFEINYAYKGPLYISVYGKSGALVSYVINVRTNYQHIYSNGQSYLIEADQSEYTQFRLYVGSHVKNLVISATLVSGFTKMYISNDGQPANATHYTWVNSEWPGNAFIIQNTNPDFKPGNWFIGVYGVVASTFYISASSYPYYAWLAEGVPMLGKAPADGTPMVYAYWLPYVADDKKSDYALHIRAIAGPVDVYVIQDYNVIPSKTNFTFFSSGDSDRTLYLPKTSLKFSSSLYIGVYGRADFGVPTFQLTMGTSDSPKFLGQDQPQSIILPPKTYSYYQVMNRYAKSKVSVFTESCNNSPAPKVYLSALEEKPQADSSDAVASVALTDYPRSLVQSVSVDSLAEQKFYLGVGNLDYASDSSIYVTTGDDARPSLIKNVLEGANMDNSMTVMIVPTAKASSREMPGNFLTYNVYITEIAKDQNFGVVNMHTTCGIKRSGLLVTSVVGNPASQNIQIKFSVDKSRKYIVNVLAQDNIGLSIPYTPSYIVNGVVIAENTSDGGSVAAAVIFSLLAVFLVLGIAGYIGGGIAYKHRQGHRGIEMIPNIDLWRKIFTCGRYGSSYSTFDDDRVNTSGFGSTNNSSRGEAQPINSSGYGSI